MPAFVSLIDNLNDVQNLMSLQPHPIDRELESHIKRRPGKFVVESWDNLTQDALLL